MEIFNQLEETKDKHSNFLNLYYETYKYDDVEEDEEEPELLPDYVVLQRAPSGRERKIW